MQGGIQPSVWKKIFGGSDSIYLSDGTVFRFLVTYEGYHIRKHTKESWNDKSRAVWEQLLKNAKEWSDKLISKEGWKPKAICLSEDAQDLFLDWCNNLEKEKLSLPEQLRGYIPKFQAYSLRLAGALYCMECFAQNKTLGLILSPERMQKGIDTVSFYAGHIVDAMQSLCSNEFFAPVEITEQVKCLAKTLESLRDEVDNGRLAVGYIWEKYNKKSEEQITQRMLGSLLRKNGLTLATGRHRANKKVGAHCLEPISVGHAYMVRALPTGLLGRA